ncbi:MAG: hypothetical protein Q4E76_05315 [Tissierellia bacterium]|nr:hypothetical protein [Tissierellia bacterium]
MKKISLTLALAALLLVGCGQGETPAPGENEGNKAPAATETEGEKDKAQGEAPEDEEKPEEENKEESNEEEKAPEEEESIYVTGTEEEIQRALIRDADYISLVELATSSNGGTELRIVQNFKGSLSNIEFEAPEGLSANNKYMIFYHDGEDGTIEPVDKKHGIYQITGTDDPFFTSVQERYAPEDLEKAKKAKEDEKKAKAGDGKEND